MKRLEIQGPSPRAYDSGWKHHDGGGAQWQQVPGLANGHGRFACPLKLHTVAALAERADSLHPSHPIRQVKYSSATLELLGAWSYFLSCHSLEVHHDDSRRRHSLFRPRENDCSIASSHGRATGCNDSVTHRVRSYTVDRVRARGQGVSDTTNLTWTHHDIDEQETRHSWRSRHLETSATEATRAGQQHRQQRQQNTPICKGAS